MGALRDRFWERPIEDLSRPEWEALCDGCGRCCLHKIIDDDSGKIHDTNVACKLLDPATARCRDYGNRKSAVPDCLQLEPEILADIDWLPSTCAYRMRAAGRPLPDWHYLICGDRDAVLRSGVSVAGRVISETDSGPLDHHIVDWNDVDGHGAEWEDGAIAE